MTNLINVWETEKGNQAVSARELYQFLEVGREFANWIKARIEKYGFIENKDFYKLYFNQHGNMLPIVNSVNIDSQRVIGGRIEYVLTLNMAKELAMVENNEKGKEARRYFIQCEEQFRAMKEQTLKQLSPEELKWKKWEYLSKTLEKINDEKQIKAITSAFLKEVTGDEIVPYEKTERKTYTATELSGIIKSRYDIEIPRNVIGRLANKYDLKRSEYGVFTNYKTKYGIDVSNFHYYEEVIEKLKDIITKYEKKLNINF